MAIACPPPVPEDCGTFGKVFSKPPHGRAHNVRTAGDRVVRIGCAVAPCTSWRRLWFNRAPANSASPCTSDEVASVGGP